MTRTEKTTIEHHHMQRVHCADDTVREALEQRLSDIESPADGWVLVKRNPSRSVYRGRLAGRDVYLKHFHHASALRNLLRQFGICDARRELTLSEHLNRSGASATPVLAASWRGAKHWVLTQAVAPAEELGDWLRQNTDPCARRETEKSLAKLIAKMHDAGVMHKDLHCGNVMRRTDTGQLVLMDLHRAERKSVLTREQRIRNLAQLCYDRLPYTTRPQQLRFLKNYLEFANVYGSIDGWEWSISNQLRAHAARLYAQRDRRSMKTNRYFARLDLGKHRRAHVVLASKRKPAFSSAANEDFAKTEWKKLLQHPEALLSGEGARAVKDSQSGTVVRRPIQIGDRTVDVFVKRPLRKKAWKGVIDCFRISRSVRAFKLGHMLITRRIATALPLLALEERSLRRLRYQMLIAETVDAPRLEDFLIENLRPDATLRQLRLGRLGLERLGRALRRLHDHGFSHRDLKAINILMHASQTDPTPVFVDLDGLSKHWRLWQRRRYCDLARLDAALAQTPNVGLSARLRLVTAYLARPGWDGEYKPYFRFILDRSEKIVRRRSERRRKTMGGAS